MDHSYLKYLLAALLALVIARSCVSGCGESGGGPQPTDLGVLPEIQSFLSRHPEFGKPTGVQAIPDWASGRRQRVDLRGATGQRNLLFYTRGDSVSTVYEDGPNGRRKVWGGYVSYQPAPPRTVTSGSESLPAYTVLFQVRLAADGRLFGEVLVPSFSRQTAVGVRERAAKSIAAKEGFGMLYLYSTRDAYEANMSASYLRSHPNALRVGFLGTLDAGSFTPGERTFP